MPLTGPTPSASARPVLVTGASGFIGSRIVDALVQAGSSVLAMVRDRSRIDRLLPHAASPHLAVIEGDLLDAQRTSAMIDALRPAMCVHAAWDVARSDYMGSSSNQHWVRASLGLAGALARNGCSWMGVCGTGVEPRGSEAASSRYAAAKATLRHRLRECAADRITICWWRIHQPYGPGERPDRFIPSMIESLASGQRFTVRQPHALRDFVHVQDVASAVVASHQHALGGVFDIGSGTVTRLADAARIVATQLRAEHLLDCAIEGESPPQRSHAADIAGLQDLTGWTPRVRLEDGLSQLIAARAAAWRATA